MKLEKHIKLVGGGTPSKKKPEYWNGDIPWASVKDFKSKKLATTVDKITKEGLENSSSKLVEKGNLIIATRMAVGKAVITEIDVAINQDLKAVYTSEEIDNKYLQYFFDSQADYFERTGKGATVKGIKIGDIQNLKIPLLSLSEQKAIVAKLDRAQRLIDIDKEMLAKYDELIQSVFLEMFGDQFEQELKRLGDHVKFSQGKQVGVELQLHKPKEGYSRFLRIVDFTQGDDIRYVPNEDKKYVVKNDDIVIVRYGASAGFVGTNKEGVLANNLFKVNYNREQFNQNYLYYLFQSNSFKNFIEKEAFGAAMPALSFKVMKRFKIPIPDIAMQKRFSEKIVFIEGQKTHSKISLKKSEELFLSLVQGVFG